MGITVSFQALHLFIFVSNPVVSAVNLSVRLDKVRAKLVAGLGVLQDVPFHPHIVRTKKKKVRR